MDGITEKVCYISFCYSPSPPPPPMHTACQNLPSFSLMHFDQHNHRVHQLENEFAFRTKQMSEVRCYETSLQWGIPNITLLRYIQCVVAPPSHHQLHPHTISSTLTPSAPSSHHQLHPHTISSTLTPSAPPSHHQLHPHTISSTLTPSAPPSHHQLHPHTISSTLTPSAPPSHHQLHPHTISSTLTPSAPSSHHQLTTFVLNPPVGC